MQGVRRGFLKYYILKLLSDDSYTGYGLIKKIEEETGFWEPSTGSVYPLLESLEEEGLIEGEGSDGGSPWAITEKGKEAYEEASEARKEMKESLKNGMIVFSQVFNEERIKRVAERMAEESNGENQLRKKLHGLHRRVDELITDPSFDEDELFKLIKDTHERLDELKNKEG